MHTLRKKQRKKEKENSLWFWMCGFLWESIIWVSVKIKTCFCSYWYVKKQADLRSISMQVPAGNRLRSRSTVLWLSNPDQLKLSLVSGYGGRAWVLQLEPLRGLLPACSLTVALSQSSLSASHCGNIPLGALKWSCTVTALPWVPGSNYQPFPEMACPQPFFPGILWALGLEALTSCCLSKNSCRRRIPAPFSHVISLSPSEKKVPSLLHVALCLFDFSVDFDFLVRSFLISRHLLLSFFPPQMLCPVSNFQI